MHCSSTIPEVGGHTNFRNAGVHVKPTTGGAVFFSYIDVEKRITDKGFTEHSGCPVLEGEKKIVTQWIRLGVDSENPWHSFNSRKYNFWRIMKRTVVRNASWKLHLKSHSSFIISYHLFLWKVGLKKSNDGDDIDGDDYDDDRD